ncbi:craniofacial development protein 2-like [Penaeus indicus]|uniref:craniofacial development protein 2-like n=1 Tax=Penaeus indicus TaxID=29960 RepID=UPI00300C2F1D
MRLAKEEFTAGTGNVRTLHQEGKVNQLTYELDRYQWNVLGIAEMRWLDSVMECEPISSQVIRIRMNAHPRNVSIVQVYDPTSDCSDEEVDEVYDVLKSTMDKIPEKYIRIIQGDWNAKIGTDAYKDWEGTIGKFGVGETNERGTRLLEFCKINNPVITNTFGADTGSDHNLLMMTMKLKLRKVRRQPNCRLKYNLERLRDADCQEKFEIKIGCRFGALLELEENDDVQHLTSEFSKIMNETAMEVLGKARTKKQPWMTQDILDACDRRTKGFEGNNSKKAFDTVKQLGRKKNIGQSVIEDKNGNLLTEKKEKSRKVGPVCEGVIQLPNSDLS